MLVFDVVLLTLQFWAFFTPFSNVSIVDTEQVNVSWVLTPSNQAKTYTTGQGFIQAPTDLRLPEVETQS